LPKPLPPAQVSSQKPRRQVDTLTRLPCASPAQSSPRLVTRVPSVPLSPHAVTRCISSPQPHQQSSRFHASPSASPQTSPRSVLRGANIHRDCAVSPLARRDHRRFAENQSEKVAHERCIQSASSPLPFAWPLATPQRFCPQHISPVRQTTPLEAHVRPWRSGCAPARHANRHAMLPPQHTLQAPADVTPARSPSPGHVLFKPTVTS
jgi:hypothetical protein